MSDPKQSAMETSGAPEGDKYKAARESAGLTNAQVAQRLNLSKVAIENIESEAFEQLPRATFARGYIRNYAKLLGLADELMIARYNNQIGDQQLPANPLIKNNEQVKATDPVVKWATVSIVILIFMFSMLWWNNQQDVPNSAGLQAVSEEEAALIDTGQEYASDNEIEPTLDSRQISEEVRNDSGQTEAGMPEQLAKPERLTQIARNETLSLNNPSDESDGTQIIENTSALRVNKKLEVEFIKESWMEVKDAEGKLLFTGVKRAGANLELETADSFKIVIGNAKAVNIAYNGAPFDLAEHTDRRNVARLTLGNR